MSKVRFHCVLEWGLTRRCTGKRHETTPGSPSSQSLKEVLSKVLDSVSDTMKKPVCKAAEPLDLRSEIIRTQEVSGSYFLIYLLQFANSSW